MQCDFQRRFEGCLSCVAVRNAHAVVFFNYYSSGCSRSTRCPLLRCSFLTNLTFSQPLLLLLVLHDISCQMELRSKEQQCDLVAIFPPVAGTKRGDEAISAVPKPEVRLPSVLPGWCQKYFLFGKTRCGLAWQHR